VEPRVSDVEQLKKRVRKQAAGQVFAGGKADLGVDLGPMRGCRVCIKAGYGPLSTEPVATSGDRLIWLLDGHAEIESPSGVMTHISQGESTVLAGGAAYHLVFPTLSIYLCVELEGQS
jgi:hypothetical protein